MSEITRPETKYAKSGALNIAYQVVGEGPIDLLYAPGWVSHVDYAWEVPPFADFLRRLASFSRLIWFDRRGTGLSDPVADLPILEQRMDDIRAVMDAAGSERAALFGISEGGGLSMLFSATYPERVSSLVLYGTFARGFAAPDYPCRPKREGRESMLSDIEEKWGRGVLSAQFAPSIANDLSQVGNWGRFERYAVSPGAARKLFGMTFDIDVRDILPAIRTPTLIMSRRDDKVTRPPANSYIADHIPGAKYIELAGEDHFPWVGDTESIASEVERFIGSVAAPAEPDRVLATLLFTDIVGSTELAFEMGDAKWRKTLESYYATVREQIVRFRGREIKTMGDGFLISFDGPARGVRCARAVQAEVAKAGLELRSGLHTGECESMGDDIGGIAVHIGARVMGRANPGEVLVSRTVKDLVAGSGLGFDDRGEHALKGIPDPWQLFAVTES